MTEKIIEKIYDNGFEVILIQKPDFIKKFAGIIIDFGASDLEGHEVETAGIAHFLEHKLFAKEDGDISLEFDNQEASVNAFTSYNETMYYATFIDQEINNIKSLFRLVNSQYFTTENVDKEREIIIQELKMYQDDPMWGVNNQLMNLLFPGNIVASDIAGSEETLANINQDSLLEIWKKYYVANNMKLVLAGDLDFNEVDLAISPLIAQLNNGPKIWTDNRLKRDFDQNKIENLMETLTGKTSHPRFGIGLKFPEFKNFLGSNDLVQMMLEIMLESQLGSMSELYQELHDKGLLQQELSYGVSYSRQGNYAKIFGQSDQYEEVIAAILDVLKTQNLDEEIFKLQKKELIAKTFRTIDRLDNLAIEVAESRLEDAKFFDDLAEFQKISFDQFSQIVRKLMSSSQIAVVTLMPEEK